MSKKLKTIILISLPLILIILLWMMLSSLHPRYVVREDESTPQPATASPTLTFTVPVTVESVEPLEPSAEPLDLMPTSVPVVRIETPAALVLEEPAYPNPPEIVGQPAFPFQATISPIPNDEISISFEDTPKGIILTVTGGPESYNYQLGPLEKGVFEIGPNRTFLVYVSDSGIIYVHPFGENKFYKVADARQEGHQEALSRKYAPHYELTFHDNGHAFILILYEASFGDSISVTLPQNLTNY